MPIWRQMTYADLRAVSAIAAIVHPGYPEDDEIFAERLALYPPGCLLLADPDRTLGYLISHPYPFGDLPRLNTLLGLLPDENGCFYLHDIALLPAARGRGAARAAIETLTHLARDAGFARMTLTAVSGSAPFWSRLEFVPVEAPGLTEQLQGYDADAIYMSRAI